MKWMFRFAAVALVLSAFGSIASAQTTEKKGLVMKIAFIFAIMFSIVLAAGSAEAQLPVKQVLTLDVAKKIAAAAEAEAKKRGAKVVIAVVDDGGYLLVLERLDDTQVASVDVGIAKARTAAIFRRPSKVFEDQVKNGRIAALALPGAVALQGGVPIVVDGRVVGAIGVSGNSPQEDEDIAKVGADSAVAAIKGVNK
jgi:glc operon protein GlcG